MMNKLLRRMNATCRDASLIISESLDHPLPFSKMWRLKFHLVLCKVCGFYLDQLKIIQNLARDLGKEDNTTQASIGLRPETKEKLKQTLKSS